MTRCVEITKRGRRCKKTAMKGFNVCHIHSGGIRSDVQEGLDRIDDMRDAVEQAAPNVPPNKLGQLEHIMEDMDSQERYLYLQAELDLARDRLKTCKNELGFYKPKQRGGLGDLFGGIKSAQLKKGKPSSRGRSRSRSPGRSRKRSPTKREAQALNIAQLAQERYRERQKRLVDVEAEIRRARESKPKRTLSELEQRLAKILVD